MKNVTKIEDPTTESKRGNVLGKLKSVGETREIETKYGESRKLTEVLAYSSHLNAKVQGIGCFGYYNHFTPILAVPRRESLTLCIMYKKTP